MAKLITGCSALLDRSDLTTAIVPPDEELPLGASRNGNQVALGVPELEPPELEELELPPLEELELPPLEELELPPLEELELPPEELELPELEELEPPLLEELELLPEELEPPEEDELLLDGALPDSLWCLPQALTPRAAAKIRPSGRRCDVIFILFIL